MQIPVVARWSALIVALTGIMIGLFYHIQLWQIGADGLSVVSHTTPYWDFNNLWSGSRFALAGHVDWLFDMDVYRQQMQLLLGQNLPPQEWSYPPSMLLLGAPFSLLPVFPAYVLWTGGMLVLLHFALRQLQLPLWAHIAILASPAVFINALIGQNGALMATLLLTGLFHIKTKPVLAGICIGLMTIKPQYGILLPVVLIAGKDWKVFVTAAATGTAMFALTGFLFGFGVWLDFLNHTRPMMTAIMEAPFIQPYHTNAIPVFVFGRAIGLSVGWAYALQALVTLGAIAYCWHLWQAAFAIAKHQRIALTCVLVILATPYAYTYDMVVICAAIIIFFASDAKTFSSNARWIVPLAPLWLFPLYSHILAALYHINTGALVVVGVLVIMLINLKQGRNDQIRSRDNF